MARPSQLPTQRPKRVRFQTSGSSDPAATSTADDSAVGSDQDSDSSELSESSEDPSSESSDEDEDEALDVDMNERQGKDGVTNLRAGQGKKPTMKFDRTKLGPDIRIFLKDFLPQLKAANDELESHRKAGTLKSREIDMTDADDVEEYIEMVSQTLEGGMCMCMANVDQDLGLGVLEEKKPNADDDASSESDSDDEMEGVEKEKDVLGKLLGRAGTKDNVVIQEVQGA
jgi:hypothetical protein